MRRLGIGFVTRIVIGASVQSQLLRSLAGPSTALWLLAAVGLCAGGCGWMDAIDRQVAAAG